MAKTCESYKEIVQRFCDEIHGEKNHTAHHEDIKKAFHHIYYCPGAKCCALWWELDKNETNQEIRNWIRKWDDKPDAMSFGLSPWPRQEPGQVGQEPGISY